MHRQFDGLRKLLHLGNSVGLLLIWYAVTVLLTALQPGLLFDACFVSDMCLVSGSCLVSTWCMPCVSSVSCAYMYHQLRALCMPGVWRTPAWCHHHDTRGS